MGSVLVMAVALTLAPGNWEPGVRTELNRLVERHAGDKSAYAVFDFDNTTAIGDISNVCQWRMLETLAFKADVAMSLKSGIPERYHARVDRMTACVPALQKLDETTRLASPAWHAFAQGYWTLYRDLLAECGTDVGYPWIGHPFAGYTSEEYQTFARAAARRMLAKGTGLSTDPDAPPQFPRGFMITPEMRDLFRTLTRSGIAVYIVSASNWELVQAMLDPEFGLEVDRDKVHAYRLKKDASGRYLPQFDEGTLRPQAAGKVAIIRRHIAPRHGGAEPILTAGDSMGDYNMFTEFPRLEAALVFNRNPKAGPLADLIRRAPTSVSPKILVQGRDAAAGRLLPTHDSK